MLTALAPVDTRPLFRPMCLEFAALLGELAPDQWHRPTAAGHWLVRDVVSHLVDGALRRVSFHRDRHEPPPVPPNADLPTFIAALNGDWVRVSRRLSPRMLCTLYHLAAAELADFAEGLDLDAPALFPVSWAGESASRAWLDIGREFTEQWHHQMQVRDGVGAGDPSSPGWLRAVLEVSLRALPHGLADIAAADGTGVQLDVDGRSGGAWAAVRREAAWVVYEGRLDRPACRLRLEAGVLARAWFHALSPEAALRAASVEGDRALAEAVLRTRAVVV